MRGSPREVFYEYLCQHLHFDLIVRANKELGLLPSRVRVTPILPGGDSPYISFPKLKIKAFLATGSY